MAETIKRTVSDIINKICDTIKDYMGNTIIVHEKIIIPDQPKEREDDNREYKLYLDFNDCKRKFENRSTQMLNRLILGNGKALYLIGLYDDGRTDGISLSQLELSINNVCKMAMNIGGSVRRIAIYDTRQLGKYVAAIRVEIPDEYIEDDMFII